MTRSSRPSTHRPDSAGGRNTVVVGIDPGTLVTGYGVVRRQGGGLVLLACGTIRARPGSPLARRLLAIHRELRVLLRTFRPDTCAIESALKLGHAHGVSLLAAAQHGVPTAEYSPGEVKKAVVGRGGATKEQVQFMVRSMLGVRDSSMMHDASDAVAVALCHLQRATSPASEYRDWSSFVAAHPDRVRR